MNEPTSDQFWQAILNNDASFDDVFIYGVITTGVYCLPSCAGRKPKRENVRFFSSSQEAEQAGLRSCKKCKPTIGHKKTKTILEIAAYIAQHSEQELKLDTLAHLAGLSPTYLQKKFKAEFGVSPKAFHADTRLKRLKKSLRHGTDVTTAIFEAGFGSTSRVYEQVNGQLGMTPTSYRKGGAGEVIFYASCQTGLGELLMAATERGVCFVHIGDSREALVSALKHEYPKAQVEPSPMQHSLPLRHWLELLVEHVDQMKAKPDIPLDLRGSTFQLKVWRFLMSIKEGEVKSYAEVANAIGASKAYRAAANACGANNLAILIPCHRVLRGDGSLGGYRWGTDRKRTLLEVERKRARISNV